MGEKSSAGRLIRGLAMGKQLKFAVAVSTPITKTIMRVHRPSPQGLLAMSRTATAVALLSATLKDRQQVGIQINGSGVLGELYAVSTSRGEVRVTTHDPQGSAEPFDDVGAAVGQGRFTLIKTSASGKPYRGTVPLFTGGIAEDLAYYFMYSEQIPTACGLGERLEGGEVIASGGYLVQSLPNPSDEVLQQLETNVLSLPKLQDILLGEHALEEILQGLFKEDYELLQESEICFSCQCERPRYARTLITLGKAELTKLRDEEGEITLSCHFCASEYQFNREELSALIYGAR